jgi:hypothetical protein
MPNPALEPTPGGRVRVHRVPALGSIQPRTARLNANRWADRRERSVSYGKRGQATVFAAPL